MRRSLLLGLTLLLALPTFAQWDVDLAYGTSKADDHFGTLRVSRELTPRVRVGVSYEFADYQYRFIDARPVSDGFAGTLRLLLVGQLAEAGNLRLDGFLKPGYRYLGLDDESLQDFNYAFAPSHALTLDPGLLLTAQLTNNLRFHTGVNLHMAFQVAPEPIFEQFPSSRILAGGSYRLLDRWTLFAVGQAGPMAGASGDTEKFFWLTSFGVRYSFGQPSATRGLIGY